MALLKMGQAARRAGAGSTSTVRRALTAAGIPIVQISPGVFGVEEADLERFLQQAREAIPPGQQVKIKDLTPSKTKKKSNPKPDRRR